MTELVWLVPLLPLIGFIINGLGFGKISKNLATIIGCGSVLLSFIIAAGIFYEDLGRSGAAVQKTYFTWITDGNISVDFSFLVDRLSIIMMLIITGVGLLIHIYSAGYMHDDAGFGKFFAYMNLFMFNMLVLVLGSNYVMLFIGWEGVGLCSYLLIGFWYKNHDYTAAANKAFIMNRIGDLGFLLGIFLIFKTFGTSDFTTVFNSARSFSSGDTTIALITLFLFIGAMGKSAQIPLFTWLPDAMAGPTPVSALIHAATMVTAGIYMIARSNIMYALAPSTSEFVAIIGALTALMAGIIAMTQTDIKKVLAYSTVSQLGYMFVALGVTAYSSAMFHVMTHAFFKALLFLGAGSVIHAMSGEQNMRKMGGLRKHLPITFMTMAIATLAIAGFPPFAGFFSKDEILSAAYSHSMFLFVILAFTSVLTAAYMFRLFFLTFFGEFRGTKHQLEHIHESPKSMTVPLMILMVLSAVAGFLGIPEALGGKHFLSEYFSPVFGGNTRIQSHEVSHLFEYVMMIVSVVVVILIYQFIKARYDKKEIAKNIDESKMSLWYKLSLHKFYVDELYDRIIVKPLNGMSNFFFHSIEKKVIDGAVNGGGQTVYFFSSMLKNLQSGNIGFYVLMMVIGIVAILFFSLVNTINF